MRRSRRSAAVAAGLAVVILVSPQLAANSALSPKLRLVELPVLFMLDRDAVALGATTSSLVCELDALRNGKKIKLAKRQGSFFVRAAVLRDSGGVALGTGLVAELAEGRVVLSESQLGESLQFTDGIPEGRLVLEARFRGGSGARIDDVSLACELASTSKALKGRQEGTSSALTIVRAFNFGATGFDAQGANEIVSDPVDSRRIREISVSSGLVILEQELLTNEFEEFSWHVSLALERPNGKPLPAKKAKGKAFGWIVAMTGSEITVSPEIRTRLVNGTATFDSADLRNLGNFLDGIAKPERAHVYTRVEGKGAAKTGKYVVTTRLDTAPDG